MTLLTGTLTSWKTTTLGLIPVAAAVARLFGVEIPTDQLVELVVACYGLALVLARDANRTSQGATVEQVATASEPAKIERVATEYVEVPR